MGEVFRHSPAMPSTQKGQTARNKQQLRTKSTDRFLVNEVDSERFCPSWEESGTAVVAIFVNICASTTCGHKFYSFPIRPLLRCDRAAFAVPYRPYHHPKEALLQDERGPLTEHLPQRHTMR